MVKVFLGNMPYHEDEVSEEDIRGMFRKFGGINQIIIKKGYGFVDFADHQGAKDACDEMDQLEFQGRKLRVSLAYTDDERKRNPRPAAGTGYGRPDDRTCTSLFVANIPPDTTIDRLKDFFEKYGRVENVKVLPQKGNNPNISAFVDFEVYDAAARAHEDDLNFEGKYLRTDFSSNRKSNQGRPAPVENKRSYDDHRGGRYGDERRYPDDNRGRSDTRRDYSPAPPAPVAARSRSRDRSRGRREDPPPVRRREEYRSPPRRDERPRSFDDRRDAAPRDDRRDYAPRGDDRREPVRDDRSRDYARDDYRNDRRDDRSPLLAQPRASTNGGGRAMSPQRSWSRGRSPPPRR
ncbi:Aste57867_19410 [Aphanomyces stellatus]|uniref:Aste57867_19410 protein n=1 Tax=Aphanomyces stellatus TaxID=120398 RepID=A0A485LD39_9STRA|nr:hypothetical protein As57867_019346 [Aphanomyces stellatus]VFT96124.1 Aste57867_19410 [Aphanomyces stellatus]